MLFNEFHCQSKDEIINDQRESWVYLLIDLKNEIYKRTQI